MTTPELLRLARQVIIRRGFTPDPTVARRLVAKLRARYARGGAFSRHEGAPDEAVWAARYMADVLEQGVVREEIIV